jgi:hypothetical protein
MAAKKLSVSGALLAANCKLRCSPHDDLTKLIKMAEKLYYMANEENMYFCAVENHFLAYTDMAKQLQGDPVQLVHFSLVFPGRDLRTLNENSTVF